MISLYYTTKDRFSLYGIHHFIEKFGIPVEINKPSQSGIVIVYGAESKPEFKSDFIIQIIENEIKNNICGRISTEKEKIPLCEIPNDTGGGNEVLAWFENEDGRYPCITLNDSGVIINVDIFKETGHMLSGHLDIIGQTLGSAIQKELAAKPYVDFFENILFTAILGGHRNQNFPLVQKSFWPDGKPFAVCLTHDVDEIKKTTQWITSPLRYLVRMDFRGLLGQINSLVQKINGIEPYYTFEDIIRIENSLGTKSTYFILKERERAKLFSKKTWKFYGRNRTFQSFEIKTLLSRLKENGNEIATHGSFFSFKKPELIYEETQELEQLIKEKVLGIRQHHLNLEIPKTWEYQVKRGLKYDSSLGFNETIGFRWGTSYPFFPNKEGNIIPILEIPLIIMDNCLESHKNKELDCLKIIDEVEKYNGVLTLLWHPPTFNTMEYLDARDIYININQYCQEKGAWIARAKDIYNWLSIRNQQTFSCLYSDSTCTIIPSNTNSNLFFTIYLHKGTNATIRSENADIIGRERDYINIRSHDLSNNNKIIVDIP